MSPQIENYDYTKYIVKVASVLTEVLKVTTVDNKRIIESFKGFYLDERLKEITISNMFDKYKKYVEENVGTDRL